MNFDNRVTNIFNMPSLIITTHIVWILHFSSYEITFGKSSIPKITDTLLIFNYSTFLVSFDNSKERSIISEYAMPINQNYVIIIFLLCVLGSYFIVSQINFRFSQKQFLFYEMHDTDHNYRWYSIIHVSMQLMIYHVVVFLS